MDEQTLADYLRSAGGQPNDMGDAMARLMAPDSNIEALMGPQRKPQYPSLADTLGRQAQAYNQMPNGPVAGVEPQGQMPVINPYAPRSIPPMMPPPRGFR